MCSCSWLLIAIIQSSPILMLKMITPSLRKPPDSSQLFCARSTNSPCQRDYNNKPPFFISKAILIPTPSTTTTAASTTNALRLAQLDCAITGLFSCDSKATHSERVTWKTTTHPPSSQVLDVRLCSEDDAAFSLYPSPPAFFELCYAVPAYAHARHEINDRVPESL